MTALVISLEHIRCSSKALIDYNKQIKQLIYAQVTACGHKYTFFGEHVHTRTVGIYEIISSLL